MLTLLVMELACFVIMFLSAGVTHTHVDTPRIGHLSLSFWTDPDKLRFNDYPVLHSRPQTRRKLRFTYR